jgi:stage IV sporulation protein FB
MRDPFSWSFPLCHVFGITVRIHFLMPVVMLGLVLKATRGPIQGMWIDAAMLMGLLFFSVLLHEFGHSFAARRMDGDSNEVLLWPLGGLARVEIPHTPWAHFVVAAAGPMVNLALCLGAGLALAFLLDHHYRPPLNPLVAPYRVNASGSMVLDLWSGDPSTRETTNIAAIVLARFFWVNWLLSLLNLALVGFPMDCGRMLQSALWPRLGYRQATLYAIFAGFFCMILLFVASIYLEDVLLLGLGIFIYMACKQEWVMLESGAEDSVFGYDFSQGYTSLERDEPPPPRPREPNFVQRWLRRRADRKRQLEQEQQLAEERRMDELLEKIQRQGKESLTDEEQRFLKRVANRYRKKSP